MGLENVFLSARPIVESLARSTMWSSTTLFSNNRKVQRARPLGGLEQAKLISLTCSKPPKGRARWTLRLLENKVVELHIVDRASDSTIGRALKKTFSSPIVDSAGSSRPRPTARS